MTTWLREELTSVHGSDWVIVAKVLALHCVILDGNPKARTDYGPLWDEIQALLIPHLAGNGRLSAVLHTLVELEQATTPGQVDHGSPQFKTSQCGTEVVFLPMRPKPVPQECDNKILERAVRCASKILYQSPA